MRGRDSLPSFCPPLPFVFNWLGEISPPKQDGTPQTFCSSEEGKQHPFDKCLHFVLPDVFLHPLLLSDFIFVRVRTWKMAAIVVSQLEPQQVFHGEMLCPGFLEVLIVKDTELLGSLHLQHTPKSVYDHVRLLEGHFNKPPLISAQTITHKTNLASVLNRACFFLFYFLMLQLLQKLDIKDYNK